MKSSDGVFRQRVGALIEKVLSELLDLQITLNCVKIYYTNNWNIVFNIAEKRFIKRMENL